MKTSNTSLQKENRTTHRSGKNTCIHKFDFGLNLQLLSKRLKGETIIFYISNRYNINRQSFMVTVLLQC